MRVLLAMVWGPPSQRLVSAPQTTPRRAKHSELNLSMTVTHTHMRAEIVAYMIYLEGPEFSQYAMHILYLKYSGPPNMEIFWVILSQVGPAQQPAENYLKFSGCPQ